MAIQSCQLTAVRSSDGYVVRVSGHGTMNESRAFLEFAASCLINDSATLVVDLTRCEYLDSTFLGTLVAVHKRSSCAAVCRFVVAGPTEKRTSLLSPTRIDRLFRQIDAAPEAIGEPQSIEPLTTDPLCLGRHVMECHQALAQIEGPHQEEFASVAERLARELGQ